MPTRMTSGEPRSTAARASPSPPSLGKLLCSGSGSGRVLGQRKRSARPRPTLFGLTRHFGGGGGGCPAVVTPVHYAHNVRCPHHIQTLQRVVDEVSLPMWLPGQCTGTSPVTGAGPKPPKGGAGGPYSSGQSVPRPVWDVTQVVKVYETVHTSGYHHLGKAYTPDHNIVEERAVKERAPTRKRILGLRTWLTRHSAV